MGTGVARFRGLSIAGRQFLQPHVPATGLGRVHRTVDGTNTRVSASSTLNRDMPHAAIRAGGGKENR